ncbi:MAG: hypothetical protein DMG57_16025 [Acidobacteria bacterium]|nr:MAG: hypothetical protein DMG57_16025 [Acidobacteriota bacterium]
MDLAPAVRNAIWGLDKNQPVAEIGTLEEALSRSTAVPRFTTFVIGVRLCAPHRDSWRLRTSGTRLLSECRN